MRLTVPFHNKDLKRRTLESIIEQADLPPATTYFPVRDLRDCDRPVRHSMNKEARPSVPGAMPNEIMRPDLAVRGSIYSSSSVETSPSSLKRSLKKMFR
jgi:hypothetical protein